MRKNTITTRLIAYLLLIANVLSSCASGNKQFSIPISDPAADSGATPIPVQEIIVFCGNPGVGKSCLLNSIFQEAKFESGLSVGTGLTIHEQLHIHDSKLYIDTPGLSDIKLRQQAATEIEKALKHGLNYKIFFIATEKAARLNNDDMVTINTVCDAIQTDFEYGLIINKINTRVIKKIEGAGGISQFLTGLHKQPADILYITKDTELEDEDNVFLAPDSQNRKNLLAFIDKLNSKKIEEKQVQTIDIQGYEARIAEMEEAYKKKNGSV